MIVAPVNLFGVHVECNEVLQERADVQTRRQDLRQNHAWQNKYSVSRPRLRVRFAFHFFPLTDMTLLACRNERHQ